ncbi:MAG: hypothetical protein HC795_01245 [Coleofasciculaceae cyanobacterium RL_1_1]|nr:hypothetical protein [Coleofasciculaceae cyanobacterium RL_1_1]
MTNSDLHTLARWMTGQFDNLDQSQRDPAWFVALRLWCQPLPPTANVILNDIAGTEGAIGLFVEQAPLPAGDKPYRQRLFLLCPAIADHALTVEYFGFHDQRPYIGAGLDPSRLAAISHDAIQTLNNARFPLVRSVIASSPAPIPIKSAPSTTATSRDTSVSDSKFRRRNGSVSIGASIPKPVKVSGGR